MNKTPIRRLEDHLAETVGDQPVLVKAEEAYDNVATALGGDLTTFTEHYAPTVESIRQRKEKAGEPPVSYLNGVLTFIELLMESRKDKYVAVYQKGGYGSNVLEYHCLDPSLAVKPVVDDSDGTLIMSGTISPLGLFADVLGLRGAELRSYPAIQTSGKIGMTIDARVTTTYRERSPEMLHRIGETISEALAAVPNGALIFFPQRDLMERSLEAWTRSELMQVTGGRPYLGGKPLFREGRDARANQDMVARYKMTAVTPGGAVLTCVFRGRNSEGSNFPDDQCRGIFLGFFFYQTDWSLLGPVIFQIGTLPYLFYPPLMANSPWWMKLASQVAASAVLILILDEAIKQPRLKRIRYGLES